VVLPVFLIPRTDLHHLRAPAPGLSSPEVLGAGRVLEIAGQKLLNRLDLIKADDPLLPLVRLHDQQCILPDMVEVSVQLQKPGLRDRTLEGLKELVEKDLMFRTIAIDQFQLSVARNSFNFGRPLFQLLIQLG